MRNGVGVERHGIAVFLNASLSQEEFRELKNEGEFFLEENSWLILDKRRHETEELSKNIFYLEQGGELF